MSNVKENACDGRSPLVGHDEHVYGCAGDSQVKPFYTSSIDPPEAPDHVAAHRFQRLHFLPDSLSVQVGLISGKIVILLFFYCTILNQVVFALGR